MDAPSTSHNQTIVKTPEKKRTLSPALATTPSAYESPVKKRLCRRVIELSNVVKSKNKKLRQLRDSNRRLKRKIISMASLLSELEKKSLITAENLCMLDSLGVKCKEIIKRQILERKSGTIIRNKYSPQLRTFALTLNFYSTKAYNYVRSTFNTCLPSPKTLGKWYRSVDGRAGFTQEAFEVLKYKAEHETAPIYCCIVFDEMKIKSKVEKNFGYVDFGDTIDSDCKEECTDALVFLVVPLHGRWKVPIGYFLINKLKAEQKKFLLTQAIDLCTEANIVVKAVTFDGCPTNLAMAKKLGCDFNPDNLKTVFKVGNNEIAMFLDPAHMIKLIRNAFEYYGEFKDAEQNTIQWSHIELLHRLQEEEMFHAANKLRSEHLLFKKNIMKVKLATQLFSRSVAIALQFCKNTLKLNEFQNIEGTAKMLLILNDLFDILDSKVHGYKLKRALNVENAEVVLSKLESCRNTLMTLTVNIQNKLIRLVDSPRYTGFVGLCVCIESAKFLYNVLIKTQHCNYISFHRISQDHIELFFCNIRCHGGSNNNPTPKQFFGIYRKMLVHMELQPLNTGNCVALENIGILNCSSAVKRINLTTERGGTSFETEESISNNVLESLQQISFTQFSESIIEYIAGAVVHYLTRNIKCITCIKALVSLDQKKKSLIHGRDVGGLLYPSNTVTKICRRCEKVIRSTLNEGHDSKLYYKDKFRLVTLTLRSLVNEVLFPQIQQHHFDHENCNHVIELAKSVMEKYIDIRLLYLTKRTDPKNAVRRIYTKLIHFKNQ